MSVRPRLVPFALVALALLGSAAGAEVVGLLKVDGVPGDSDVPGYSDWIAVESVNLAPRSPSESPDRGFQVDRSGAQGSPAVTQALAKLGQEGRAVDAEITLVELSEGTAPASVMQRRFGECFLASYALNTGDPRMPETYTFSCRSEESD